MLSQLHELAKQYRRLMPPATRVIAISGVSEKTTTKEMIAAVLGERFNFDKSDNNSTDVIGLPGDLLRLDPDRDFGIFEFHTNRFGEIRTLAGLLQPDVGIITNTGVAPIEFLLAEAAIAEEMGALLEVLLVRGDGLAVLNADDRWCQELRRHTRATVVTVGIENPADIRASDINITGGITFRLNIGRKPDSVIIRLKTHDHHRIYCALQAAAVGYGMGMDLEEIREGIEKSENPTMRN